MVIYVCTLVGIDASGGGGAPEVTLYAVVAHAADCHRAALHLEVLLAVDAVAHGAGHVQRQVLHLYIVAALDGVLRVACHVQHAVALQLQLALAVDAGLLAAVSAVGQRVRSVLLGAQLYALAVGDIDGGTAGIGHGEACQRDGTLIAARGHAELTVGRAARELIRYLVIVHRVGIALCH